MDIALRKMINGQNRPLYVYDERLLDDAFEFDVNDYTHDWATVCMAKQALRVMAALTIDYGGLPRRAAVYYLQTTHDLWGKARDCLRRQELIEPATTVITDELTGGKRAVRIWKLPPCLREGVFYAQMPQGAFNAGQS